MVAFRLMEIKLLAAGGGGMIVTNNKKFAARAKHLTTQAKKDPLYYVHDEIGYNYRLTNIQKAAIGVAQLEQLPKIFKKRSIFIIFIMNILIVVMVTA